MEGVAALCKTIIPSLPYKADGARPVFTDQAGGCAIIFSIAVVCKTIRPSRGFFAETERVGLSSAT